MKTLRRILGILVMIAGVLGLVLSLAGLIAVWVVKPTLAGFVDSTLLTVNNSITTSQHAMEITGQSGGGLVQVTLNGKHEMRRVRIDPSLLEPKETEVLEDLIVAAANDARQRLEGEMQREMQSMTGGLNLPPGFKLPF